MSYQINRFSGTPLTIVDDGVIDQTTDLRFVGRNYAGYGEIQNENFLFLLESFSSATAPPKPVSGQIWYDSGTKKLKFYDNAQWRTTGGAEIANTPPSGLTVGDFWFNTVSNQLFAWQGSEFVLVGPLSVSGAGQTNFESISVVAEDGTTHAVIKALVDSQVVYIVSATSFTLNTTVNSIPGFTYINQGLTLVSSASGSSTTSARFWGTASDTDKLGGIDASEYVLASNANFTGTANFNFEGIGIGPDGFRIIYDVPNLTPILLNSEYNVISFQVFEGGTTIETIRVEGTKVIPGENLQYDLGSQQLQWDNLYVGTVNADTVNANNFSGTFSGVATQADTLLFSGSYRSATNNNVGNTIVARDSAGNFSANIITATATSARYADLAEKYESDKVYEPGTVVVFGGEKEITITTQHADTRVAGVISTAPAFIMNDEIDYPPVALRGKVPVKVIGKVSKGDLLVTSTVKGYATAYHQATDSALAVFAKSLENKDSEDPGIIFAVVI
jgi:hypothetical protein